MGEISKLNVNGADYDLKDKIAREAVGNIPNTVEEAVEQYMKGNPVSGTVTEEQIASAVETYLEDNPVGGEASAEEIRTAVEEYLTANPPSGVTDEDIEDAVNSYMEANAENLKGEKGDPGTPGENGEPGQNGVSPTVEVTTITGGHRVTITDASGTKSFDVMDGEDGKNSTGETVGTPTNDARYDTTGFEMSTTELISDMGVGINIGNYMDSCSRYTTFDYSNIHDVPAYLQSLWGCVKATKDFIAFVKACGFNTIRLPITWFDHINTDNGYIDENWLRNVKNHVDMIIDEGMYCIINVHHDGAWNRSYKRISASYDTLLNSKSYLCKLWNQIALYFKDYGYKLVFEGFNEVTKTTESLAGDAEGYDCINQFNQAFVNTVRATGGNNAERFMICSTYATMLGFDAFEMPIDSAENKLMIQVHNYSTANAYTSLKRKGDIVIGEFGYLAADKADHITEIENHISIAKANNLLPIWWDDGQTYSLFNRQLIDVINPLALKAITGVEVAQKTYEYPCTTEYQPYYAKFYSGDTESKYGEKYVVVVTEKPITSVPVLNKTTGYYSIKGCEGGIVSFFTSEDDVTYKALYSLIPTEFYENTYGNLPIWGSTENMYWLDGNYTIEGVPVEPVACTGITLEGAELTLTESADYQLGVTLEPENTTDTVSYSCDDTTIARINNAGVITPVGNGSCTITVTCGEQTAMLALTINAEIKAEFTMPTAYYNQYQSTGSTVQELLPYYLVFKVNTPISDSYKYQLLLSEKPLEKIGDYISTSGKIYVKMSDTSSLKGKVLANSTGDFSSVTIPNMETATSFAITNISDSFEIIDGNYTLDGYYTYEGE